MGWLGGGGAAAVWVFAALPPMAMTGRSNPKRWLGQRVFFSCCGVVAVWGCWACCFYVRHTSQLGANDAELGCADRTGGSGGGSGVGGGALYEITKANTCTVTSACWWSCAARVHYRTTRCSWDMTTKTLPQPDHSPGLCCVHT